MTRTAPTSSSAPRATAMPVERLAASPVRSGLVATLFLTGGVAVLQATGADLGAAVGVVVGVAAVGLLVEAALLLRQNPWEGAEEGLPTRLGLLATGIGLAMMTLPGVFVALPAQAVQLLILCGAAVLMGCTIALPMLRRA